MLLSNKIDEVMQLTIDAINIRSCQSYVFIVYFRHGLVFLRISLGFFPWVLQLRSQSSTA